MENFFNGVFKNHHIDVLKNIIKNNNIINKNKNRQ